MNSKTGCLTFILFLFIFSACQKEPDPRPLPEPGYPTTYKPLSQAKWAERNIEFQQINNYEGLSLNEFGFVEGEISISEVDSLTEEFVVNKLDSIVNRYKSFLGITVKINIESDIKINVPFLDGELSPGTISYYFEGFKYFQQQNYWPELKEKFTLQRYFITQNKINDKKFLGPTIYLTFNQNEHTLKIEKNWFPNAHIPQDEIYKFNEAISIVYRFILKETGIDIWENKHTFNQSKTFIYLEREGGIEIYECWYFKVAVREEYYFYIFIDTQTGEIIQSYKRGMYYI